MNDDHVPTMRIGSQIPTIPTSNDLPIQAPQWSTMESMQFEFDLDDLSDDDDFDLDHDSGSYETHNSWLSGQDHKDRNSENENSHKSDDSNSDHDDPEMAQNDEKQPIEQNHDEQHDDKHDDHGDPNRVFVI